MFTGGTSNDIMYVLHLCSISYLRVTKFPHGNLRPFFTTTHVGFLKLPLLENSEFPENKNLDSDP